MCCYPLALSSSWAVVIGAALAAIPATIGALGVIRKGREVVAQVTPTNHKDEPTPNIADMVQEIYQRFGILEGFLKSHEVDPDAHKQKKKRR